MNDLPRPSEQRPLRVAVVGGGIAGLAAARRLLQLRPDAEVRLFEGGERLGGPLDSVQRNGWLVERGADSFSTKLPEAINLCQELGLGDEVTGTNAQHRRALVVRNGRLHPTPEGFVLMRANKIGGVLKSRVLSLRGKLRLLAEPFIRAPARVHEPGYDESVASFAARRLGREAFEQLVQPLLAGIYVADAAKLSLAATMPEFLEAERAYGSLTRALWRGPRVAAASLAGRSPLSESGSGADVDRESSGARYGIFVSLTGGVSQLVDAVAAAMPVGCVQRGSRVDAIARDAEGGWRLAIHRPKSVDRGEQAVAERFDAVVVAVQAPHAAALLQGVDAELAALVGRIRCASSAVIGLGFRRDQIEHPLEGFGFVVPAVEGMKLVAGSFASVKYPGRVPADCVHVRAFVGGALAPEMVERDDADLVAGARTELSRLLGLRGEPLWSEVARWRESMPQYDVGHVGLVDAIEARTAHTPGLALAGSAYRGVGIPQCIASGYAAAEGIAAQL